MYQEGVVTWDQCPSEMAISAWNTMGAELDWSALPYLVESLGVKDVDVFVAELAAMRDHMRSE